MAKITVIGGGYVGLVTSACFAELGHEVQCLEVDRDKVAGLKAGVMPVQEPGLTELWNRHNRAGHLSVTDDSEAALEQNEFTFIAVGTPQSPDGSADVSYVEAAVKTAVKYSRRSQIICVKSTVPPRTCARLEQLAHHLSSGDTRWTVVSNPEFLSQGRAVDNFLRPDRIVIGSSKPEVSEQVAELYKPLTAPVVVMESVAAELVKYSSNSFLALKISFINEISRLSEHLGIDVGQVASGMGMDKRIGAHFLEAGIGWGGSCFPKDTAALENLMGSAGLESSIVSAARDVNSRQVDHVVSELADRVPVNDGRSVAVLGLTFKDGTDDVRGSQAVPLVLALRAKGYSVGVYDPAVSATAGEPWDGVTQCESLEEALLGVSAMVIATAWPEFTNMDFPVIAGLMRDRIVIDTRRCLDPVHVVNSGFSYFRLGDGRTVESLRSHTAGTTFEPHAA